MKDTVIRPKDLHFSLIEVKREDEEKENDFDDTSRGKVSWTGGRRMTGLKTLVARTRGRRTLRMGTEGRRSADS